MEKLIEDLTRDIRKTYNIPVPVTDINPIVQKIGGTIIQDPELGMYSDARIRKSGMESFEISVPLQQPEILRNITVARELGHLFLHMRYEIDEGLWNLQTEDDCFKTDSETEQEAEEFAIALLMPKKKYVEIMNRYADGNSVDIARIAGYFQVPMNAVLTRGKSLGYLK